MITLLHCLLKFLGGLCVATFSHASHREKCLYWINVIFSRIFLSNKEDVSFSAYCALRLAALIFG